MPATETARELIDRTEALTAELADMQAKCCGCLTPAERDETINELAGERDGHLRLKNELVLKAYPAMDAVDRIRTLITAQKYENDVLTVAQVRAALDAA